MSALIRGETEMRHKNSLELFDYWTSKRAGRAAPSRTDIEPADIRRLLPDVFICELAGGSSLTFRLAGTAICGLFGKELKATGFGRLWLDDGVRNADRTGSAVASGAIPAVLSLDGLSRSSRVIQAEMLLLPVLGPTGAHDRLIGLVSVFEPPYWIGHDPLAGFSTTGIRFLDQSRQPMFLGNRPEIGMPKKPHAVQPAPETDRRKVGHLIVLDGGRRD
jgi:hypothetical protein